MNPGCCEHCKLRKHTANKQLIKSLPWQHRRPFFLFYLIISDLIISETQHTPYPLLLVFTQTNRNATIFTFGNFFFGCKTRIFSILMKKKIEPTRAVPLETLKIKIPTYPHPITCQAALLWISFNMSDSRRKTDCSSGSNSITCMCVLCKYH